MKSVIADSRLSKAAEMTLARFGYNLIKLPPSRYLPEGISSHPDSLICKIKDEIITFADYSDEAAYVFQDVRELYPQIKVSFSSGTPGKSYPDDSKFNALVMGDKLFARLDSLDELVRRAAEERGLCLINVKQGYPACTTLALDPSHAITADSGMARVLSQSGIDVCLIETGHILLPPYDYGFIGGAAGVSDGRVYFMGDYSAHPSAAEIEAATRAAGLRPISLCDGLLTDLGGLVFLD